MRLLFMLAAIISCFLFGCLVPSTNLAQDAPQPTPRETGQAVPQKQVDGVNPVSEGQGPEVLLLSEKTTPLSDREIALGVENELLTSEAVESQKIDAHSEQGVVTLSGKVDNLLAKQAAFELAQQVRGVRSVIDQIIVVTADRSDESIAEDIRQAWKTSPATEAAELGVKVERAVATLEGTVDSWGEQVLAEQSAMAIRGLEQVENKIEIAAQEKRPDTEIEHELEMLLHSDAALADAEIEVTVEDGNVQLIGQVGSSLLKTRAKDLSMQAGTIEVDVRGLQVNYEADDGVRRRERLEQLTDAQIVKSVRLALRYDPRVLSFLETIDVSSDGGSVTLSGKVGGLQAKQAAERTARGTLGVWRVKNHLKVRWNEEEPSAEEIVAFVQAALRRDPYVTRQEIRVHCRNGHVSLYGLVDSEFEKKAAEWIASGQKGVVHVNNYLTVRGNWEPKSDAEIKADIEEKLTRTFFDKSNRIDVRVEDGVAILTGQVDTWRQWQLAMDKALEAGARRPHNLLKVRYHPRHGGSRIYVPR